MLSYLRVRSDRTLHRHTLGLALIGAIAAPAAGWIGLIAFSNIIADVLQRDLPIPEPALNRAFLILYGPAVIFTLWAHNHLVWNERYSVFAYVRVQILGTFFLLSAAVFIGGGSDILASAALLFHLSTWLIWAWLPFPIVTGMAFWMIAVWPVKDRIARIF